MRNESDHGMSVIVKTVTRFIAALMLLYGMFIFSHGHLTPGGGFAGGVIIALSFLCLMLSHGKVVMLHRLPRHVTMFFEELGALFFLSLALLSFTGGYFIFNMFGRGEPFKLFSAGTMPLYNLIISVKVGAGLLSIFIALSLLRFEMDKKEKTKSL